MAYVDTEKIKRNIRVNLMPNVDIDGTVTVENAERYFLNLIDKTSTADVVEVVRCKDCKWAKQVMIGQCVNWICKCPWMFERYVRDGFCNYGERRTDNETL